MRFQTAGDGHFPGEFAAEDELRATQDPEALDRTRSGKKPRNSELVQVRYSVRSDCPTRCASEMPIFSGANLAVFSMHELNPSRSPMWKIGHTNLGDRWIPVPLPQPTLFSTMFSAGLWPLKKARYRAPFCMDLKTAPAATPACSFSIGCFSLDLWTLAPQSSGSISLIIMEDI